MIRFQHALYPANGEAKSRCLCKMIPERHELETHLFQNFQMKTGKKKNTCLQGSVLMVRSMILLCALCVADDGPLKLEKAGSGGL
jgi:hypothetical protein